MTTSVSAPPETVAETVDHRGGLTLSGWPSKDEGPETVRPTAYPPRSPPETVDRKRDWNMKTQTKAEARCPGCGANAVQLEDAISGRHRCGRCGWACRIGANGKATSWLNLATAGSAKRHRPRRIA